VEESAHAATTSLVFSLESAGSSHAKALAAAVAASASSTAAHADEVKALRAKVDQLTVEVGDVSGKATAEKESSTKVLHPMFPASTLVWVRGG
jgi:hypothetical protein